MDPERSRRVALEPGSRVGRSRPVRQQMTRDRVVGRRPVVAGGIALYPQVGPVGQGGDDSPAVVPPCREGDPAVGRRNRRERGLSRRGNRLGHCPVGAVAAVDAGAVDPRVAVPLRVEDDRLAVGRPRRRAVPALVVREPPHVAPVRLHHVQLAGQVGCRGTGPRARRNRRVAAAGEENPRAVGREGRVVVSRGVPRQVRRRAGRGRVRGAERDCEDVRVAVPRADEEQPPAVRRNGRRVLQRETLDQRSRPRVTLQVQDVQVRIAAPLGGEHHPAAVGRDHAVVVEPRIRRQPPRLRTGTLEEVQIPVGRLDAAVDDRLPGGLRLLRAPRACTVHAARRDDDDQETQQAGDGRDAVEDPHWTSPPPRRREPRRRHSDTGSVARQSSPAPPLAAHRGLTGNRRCSAAQTPTTR